MITQQELQAVVNQVNGILERLEQRVKVLEEAQKPSVPMDVKVSKSK